MTRTLWIVTTMMAYLVAAAFIWNYEPATAASAEPVRIDTGAISMQAKSLPTIQPDMF